MTREQLPGERTPGHRSSQAKGTGGLTDLPSRGQGGRTRGREEGGGRGGRAGARAASPYRRGIASLWGLPTALGHRVNWSPRGAQRRSACPGWRPLPSSATAFPSSSPPGLQSSCLPLLQTLSLCWAHQISQGNPPAPHLETYSYLQRPYYMQGLTIYRLQGWGPGQLWGAVIQSTTHFISEDYLKQD